MKEQVCIYAWEENCKKISTTKLIRQFTGLGLKDSKSKVDLVLNDEEAIIIILENSCAKDFINECRSFGFKCSLVLPPDTSSSDSS